MLDLISHGVDHGEIGDLHIVEIPSQSFVAKCEEHIRLNPDWHHPPL